MLITFMTYTFLFISFMLIILVLIFSELICLIVIVNNCVFHVSSKNKVDLVIVDVPSNLLIPHMSKPLSFIPFRNR